MLFERLLNPVSVLTAMESRLNRVSTRCENATCDAPTLEEMIDILEFQSLGVASSYARVYKQPP